VNTEGRVQYLSKIVNPPGHAREAWSIFRALSEECGVTLPYDSLEEVRVRLFDLAPHLSMYHHLEQSVFGKVGLKVQTDKGKEGKIFNTPISGTMDVHSSNYLELLYD
jgi:NADH dehydrogenase (ubiquinone) Fe-S protein 1